MTNDDELSVLREIRDSMLRQEKYFEERNKVYDEQFAADAERNKRFEKRTIAGRILFYLLLIALYAIATIQLLTYLKLTH